MLIKHRSASGSSCLLLKFESGPEKSAVISSLRRALRGRVERAYLFGSIVSGPFSAASDIDLLLVAESLLPFVERGKEFGDLRKIFPSLDILVYSPLEFESLQRDAETGFWKSVFSSAERIL
jgi:predicted nucleotidyltransferase